MMMQYESALIVGAGEGLSASLARLLTIEGIKVALAARSTEKLKNLANEIGATRAACDASKPREVAALFRSLVPDSKVYVG